MNANQQPQPLDQSDEPHPDQQALPQRRVLVADDDPHIRQLLELTLRSQGYEVVGVANGHELVQLAQQRMPHLILVDLMMPQMDGYEAIRQLRDDTRTSHIPMLILTARTLPDDIIVGFETGADDYIAKPFDVGELLARVKSHLRRTAQRPVRNPLSGLPGGALLSQELRHRLEQQLPLALLHIDLDNFKTFNDTYGFARGDRAILFVAQILQDTLTAHGNSDDFVGHIGGDDFAVLSTPDRVDPICNSIISTFDHGLRQLYPTEDWQRGYLSGTDRYGILRRFSLMTLSIGVATNQHRTFSSEEEIARVAAEVKHYAKAQNGSTYAVDQRVTPLNTDIDRRNMRYREVLIISEDFSLRAVLNAALHERSYLVHEIASVEIAAECLPDLNLLALILADAQLGAPLWEFCSRLMSSRFPPPLIVLAHSEDQVAQAKRARATVCLQQPLPLVDLVLCVERLTMCGNPYTDASSRLIGS